MADNKPPVTLLEVFQYAKNYGVEITISYDPTFPGRYVLRFNKDWAALTEHIERDHRDFNGLCRYLLDVGCEKVNRCILARFVDHLRPEFEREEKENG